MVGVSGKSKACHSCKRRRITCDLQRPQCSQCIKSSLICTGYQRDRIFIHMGTTSRSQKDPTKSKASGDRIGRKSIALPPNTDSWKCLSVDVRNQAASNGYPSREFFPHALYRQQLYSAFLRQFIPNAQFEFASQRSWLMLVPELPRPTKALDVSTMAFCMASLGRRNDDLVMLKDSLGLYVQGLHEVQRALWDPQLIYRDETLAACMALAIYEQFECPAANRRAHASHHDGIAKLIELRGAEAHSYGLAHQIFLAFRTHSILQALERRQSIYLSSSSWLSRPWALIPKTFIDEVLDLCSLAPGIFEQAYKLGCLPSHDSLHSMLELVDRCWEIDIELQKFYARLENSTPGPLYWPELSKDISFVDEYEELAKVFPIAFHFLDLRMSYTLTFYWATVLMLWSGVCHLYQAISKLDLNCNREINCRCGCSCKNQMKIHDSSNSDGDDTNHTHKFDMSQLPPLGHCLGFPSIARNICQSVEYNMQECMGQLGSYSIAGPLAIAIESLKDVPGYGREVRWARAAIAKSIGRGLRILKY